MFVRFQSVDISRHSAFLHKMQRSYHSDSVGRTSSLHKTGLTLDTE